jgi:CBS-domain-containing membrane protein
MTANLQIEPKEHLMLQADTAADLMTRSPVSIRDSAALADALALFTAKAIHAAPVIDAAGHPVGVLSATDILIHEREKLRACTEADDRSVVRDLMTPAVFSVAPEAPAKRVVQDLVALNVHQLFVVDRAGVLIGVITPTDVLRGFGV